MSDPTDPAKPATMNVSLPQGLRDFVQDRVATGEYANASDYVRALIRADRERVALAKVERLVAEALASGPPVEDMPEERARFREELRAAAAAARVQAAE